MLTFGEKQNNKRQITTLTFLIKYYLTIRVERY